MTVDIRMPPQVRYIIENLNQNGFEAYIVGGCVRDSLLGKEPKDWDITTSAAPAKVKEIFGRTIDTGIAHGTVTVMRGKEGYEVTTYRIDGEYEDGRHPKNVVFTSELAEDLKRRDFTINAMAYSHKDGLIDLFDGVADLKKGKIRCVGNAMDRFGEDALRILRAIRFSAQLGFGIEAETEQAVKALASNLTHVSKERIQMELTKTLTSSNPGHIAMVFEYGIAPFLSESFPKIDGRNIVIDRDLPCVRHLRWASFLRNQTEGEAERILKELKMDNDTIASVKLLVQWWKRPLGTEEEALRRTMSRMSGQAYDDLLLMKRFTRGVPESRKELERIREMTCLIRARKDCVSLKTMAVTGQDLIGMGMEPGRAVGRVLDELLELVLKHPDYNVKETLMKEAQKAVKKFT